MLEVAAGIVGNTKASVGVTVSGEPAVAPTGNVLTNNDTDAGTICASITGNTLATGRGDGQTDFCLRDLEWHDPIA
jgi:hypothetical protein